LIPRQKEVKVLWRTFDKRMRCGWNRFRKRLNIKNMCGICIYNMERNRDWS
jgi:hypothetical protein